MHRIPLILSTPTVLWNRNLDEVTLFNNTLLQLNVCENEEIFKVLEEEAHFSHIKSYDVAELNIKQAIEILNNNKTNSEIVALKILNSIILRGPRDSRALCLALKQRGTINMQSGHFKRAVKDFELYLILETDNDELFAIYGKLTVCYYFMRMYEISRRYCQIYMNLRGKISQGIMRDPSNEKIANNIAAFDDELYLYEDCVPQVTNRLLVGLPFKGFNSSCDIPLTSSACLYKGKDKIPEGVYTSCDVPRGESVVIENPVIYSIRNPLLQCEFCFKMSEQMYTCLSCRYKTYCSLKCIKADSLLHQYECYGYKILIIPVFSADSLLRLFVRISTLLHEHIFQSKLFRNLETSFEVWETMGKIFKQNKLQGSNFLKYLKLKPNYEKLSPEKYATLVCIAFRLTFYIEKYTNLIDNYYHILKISLKQKLNLVGAILMRLHCHLVLDSREFEFLLKRDKSQVNEYEVNYSSPPILYTQKCPAVYSILQAYCDAIGEIVLTSKNNNTLHYLTHDIRVAANASKNILCARINHLKSPERIQFVKTFSRKFHMNFTKYFLHFTTCTETTNCVISLLCTTLHKFRHSCEPNVEILLLDSGVVLGNALRSIKAGEELLFSNKSHYLRHSRVERDSLNSLFGFKCQCKFCTISDLMEPVNLRMGLYCNNCRNVITPVEIKCSSCKTEYSKIFQKYIQDLSIITQKIQEGKIINASDRELEKLYQMKYKKIKTTFVPYHEIRINALLEYANFLALKNFGSKAMNIIKQANSDIGDKYDDNALLNGFKKSILEIIKMILHFNLDKKIASVSNEKLTELCNFGLEIVNSMVDHIQFQEKMDENVVFIMTNKFYLIDWKRKTVEKKLSQY